MQLQNPFPQKVRLRYLYVYACMKCGRSDRGLEIHHITGRGSASALNAIAICKECHAHVGHTHEEEQDFFLINYRFLWKEYRYEIDDEDRVFLEGHPWLYASGQ